MQEVTRVEEGDVGGCDAVDAQDAWRRSATACGGGKGGICTDCQSTLSGRCPRCRLYSARGGEGDNLGVAADEQRFDGICGVFRRWRRPVGTRREGETAARAEHVRCGRHGHGGMRLLHEHGVQRPSQSRRSSLPVQLCCGCVCPFRGKLRRVVWYGEVECRVVGVGARAGLVEAA